MEQIIPLHTPTFDFFFHRPPPARKQKNRLQTEPVFAKLQKTRGSINVL